MTKFKDFTFEELTFLLVGANSAVKLFSNPPIDMHKRLLTEIEKEYMKQRERRL